MEHFWTHPDNIAEGLGFGQFSLTHILYILLSVLLIAFIIRRYKSADDDSRLMIRKAIAVSLLTLEAVKMIVMCVTEVKASNNLPLEICSFAEYTIVLDAFLKDNKVLRKILLYLFLPAAIMSLIFPTTHIIPAFSFFALHQFIFHALIAAYALMRFAAKEVEMDYQGVWKSILAISIIAAFVYVIDYVFNRNFMFLMDTYNNFMLNIIWNLTGGGVMYDLGLVCFSIIVVHIFYFIFAAINRLFMTKSAN